MESKKETNNDSQNSSTAVRSTPPSHLQKAGRRRLWVGNLSADILEKELREMFEKHGKINDLFYSKEKHFAFIQMEDRAGAERAQQAINELTHKGRNIRVRLTTHNAAIWVGELSSTVSNERLSAAFAQFGPVERAIVASDDRGVSKGWGIVEFVKKSSAMQAISRCQQSPFLITRRARPVRVELLDAADIDQGVEEKFMQHSAQTEWELNSTPRFAEQQSDERHPLEFEFSQRWRSFFEKKMRLQSEIKAGLLKEEKQIEEEERDAYTKFAFEEQRRIREREERMRIIEEEDRRARAEAAIRAVQQLPSMKKHENFPSGSSQMGGSGPLIPPPPFSAGLGYNKGGSAPPQLNFVPPRDFGPVPRPHSPRLRFHPYERAGPFVGGPGPHAGGPGPHAGGPGPHAGGPGPHAGGPGPHAGGPGPHGGPMHNGPMPPMMHHGGPPFRR